MFVGDNVVFRLHQDCLYNERHCSYQDRPKRPVLGTRGQLEMISYFSNTVLDVRRPVAWYWEPWRFIDGTGRAHADFLAHCNAKSQNKRYLGYGFRFPMFFLWDPSTVEKVAPSNE